MTVLTGDLIGRRFGLDEQLLVGRGAECALSFSDGCVSRRHARFLRLGPDVFVRDLSSTNGTYVNGRRVVESHRLEDGDQIRIGTYRLLRYAACDSQEDAAASQVYDAAVRDAATGALKRDQLDPRLREECAFASSHLAPVALLMFDIDEFKRVNDEHGHVTGDGVLRVLVACIQRMLLATDVVVRYGGDEFIVVCRNTPLNNAVTLADRIRAAVERLEFSASGNEFRITVSAGVAGATHGETRALVGAVDRALSKAKARGRNCVERSQQ